MSDRRKQATDAAYLQGLEEGRRQKWLELVRAVGALAGELHADPEAQRVLHLVQERFAPLRDTAPSNDSVSPCG